MEARRSSLTHKFSAALEEIEGLQITRSELLDRITELEQAFKQELASHEEDLHQAKEDIDLLTEENASLREQLQGDRREVIRAQSIEQDVEELSTKHRDLLQAHKAELERQASYEMLIGQLKTDLQHKDQELVQQGKFIAAIEKAKKHLADKYSSED
jgi:chromosome segregation ATPase